MNIKHLSIKLQDACFDEDMGLVKDCIKLGADINGRVNTARYSPLFVAVGSMDYDIIRYLLEQGPMLTMVEVHYGVRCMKPCVSGVRLLHRTASVQHPKISAYMSCTSAAGEDSDYRPLPLYGV